MRPNSIRWFDRLFLSGLIIELVCRVENVEHALKMNNGNTQAFIWMDIAFFMTFAALWFAISRLASNIAKWLLLFVILSVPIGFAATAVHPEVIFAMPLSIKRFVFEILRPALYIGAAFLLFRSDARAWIAHRG